MAVIKIDISEIVEFEKELLALEKKQLPFAIRLTVNKLAENSKKNMELKEIPKLDRPTRYANNMMRVQYANKTNLTATVKVKDTALLTKRGSVGPDQVLGHLFTGGQRRGKGFEGLMQRKRILPKGMYAVPGEGVMLDANGNIPKGLIVQLLSYFNAFQESGFRANMTDKSRTAFERRHRRRNYSSAQSFNFFLIPVGDKSRLWPGIWARIGHEFKDAEGKTIRGSSIKPILMFVDRATYKQYFNLPAIVDKIIDRDFEFEFDKAFKHALATAK